MSIIKIALFIAQLATFSKSQNDTLTKPERHSTKLNIINEFDVWIRIECYNITEYVEFEQLIASETYSVTNATETVQLHDCPLPDNRESLGVILHNMGILAYRNLFIRHDNTITRNLAKEQFKNFPEPQRLTLQLRYLAQLPGDVFADRGLRNLTTLDLYTNATNLPADIFAELENLRHLNIGHNLESLCDEQFRQQNKLLHLNLSKNKLIRVSSDIFAASAAIQILQLQDNSLATLPTNIFNKLSSLTEVDLNLNSFKHLPAGLFANARELREFVFTRNRQRLSRLPANFLASLWQLARVEIRCGLESLPAQVFFNSTNIKEIVLTSNNLKQVPNDLLATQSMLFYLDFSHNRLEEIPAGLFRNTAQLRILKLANNQLRTIERNSLTQLKHLELLDLSCNQLNSQDFRLKLETSVNLKYLYLQNNSLTDLFVLLAHLPQNLRRLNLSFNQVFQLLGHDLQQLFTDNLVLNLTYNQIQTIQLQDFHRHNIHVVADLNNNPLKCDCRIEQFMADVEGLTKQLQFHTEHLTCEEPSKLKGRLLRQINRMELMCWTNTTHLSSYRCPLQCDCWLRSYDNVLVIDCSQRNLSQVPVLQSLMGFHLSGMELNVSLNQITQLPRSNALGYANCTKLFLANNWLSTIDETQMPANLTLLDIKHNQLKYLNADTLAFLTAAHLLNKILLSGNEWQCDCSDSVMLLYTSIQVYSAKFPDASQMTCHNYGGTKFLYELQDLCHGNKIIVIAASCLSLVLVLLLLALTLMYRSHIKIWLYGHNICLRLVARHDDDSHAEKSYDAFVSYSHKDEDFIANHLLPELENGQPPFKLCVHARDFLVGEYIPDQIVNAIADSRRVIVVLSPNFILSEWAQLEFKEAYRATLMERKQKLILIMYEDIGGEAELDKELKLYLKMNTYLKWGDPKFWQKLRFSMPHK